jgi:uncharacterized protein YprB with RNaseH-like and TPR domain
VKEKTINNLNMSKTLDDQAKILLWDIECTHLKADFGTILCIGYKWLDEDKVYIRSITDDKGWQKDPTNDKKVVKDFAKVLQEADVWVTYNGKRFDVPYMQAKLLEHDLPCLPNSPHVDLYFTAKHNIAISRKSLANVSWFLNLENKKTPVDGRTWKRAMTGHKKSIQYVEDHCDADVLLLEEAYLKLRPLVRTHPRVNGRGPCTHCGSDRLWRRGFYITTKRKNRRLQCVDCGAWSKEPV